MDRLAELEVRIENIERDMLVVNRRLGTLIAINQEGIGRIKQIAQATGTPATYNLRQMCARIGKSESWAHQHKDRLPPRNADGLFPVDVVEAFVRRGTEATVEAETPI